MIGHQVTEKQVELLELLEKGEWMSLELVQALTAGKKNRLTRPALICLEDAGLVLLASVEVPVKITDEMWEKGFATCKIVNFRKSSSYYPQWIKRLDKPAPKSMQQELLELRARVEQLEKEAEGNHA